MDQLIEFKTNAVGRTVNQAQERLYSQMLAKQDPKQDGETPPLTCMGCGVRVHSADELTCGH